MARKVSCMQVRTRISTQSYGNFGLDTMTGYSFTTPVWEGGQWTAPAVAGVTAAARIVNGPEDQPRNAPVQWDNIDWRTQEEQVRRLRQRIFTASQEQDWPRVRNLQKLMLRSRACTLISVRQVTQRNTGRKTAGMFRDALVGHDW